MPTPALPSGRIDTSDHNDPTWHIHAVASDFELLDAWRLPVAGDYGEFGELVTLFLSLDLANDDGSKVSNLLFNIRTRLGESLGWDDEVLTQPIPGCEEKSLRGRLSPELLTSTAAADDSASEFQLVYQTDNECALELSNSTVHVAVHFAWVPTTDCSVGQMGIYVKARGRLGRFYMPAIAPWGWSGSSVSRSR